MSKAGPIDAHIGKKVTFFRKKAGISQQELAEQICVSHPQVQKYEKAINRISAATLYEIAKVLEVCILDFYEGLDE